MTKELAASAPSAMKFKVVVPPDLDAITLPLRGSVVPAARRLIITRAGCVRWRLTLPTAMEKGL